ncbi:hypothetical protein GCM10018952_41180 [Streptosporangium vulgare]
MAVVVEQLKKKYPGGATVALAVNQTESGQGYAQGFKKAIEGTNLKIIKEAPLTDPNAAATTLKASGAQVLVDAGVTTDCLTLSMAVGRAGWKPDTFVQPANCVDGKSLYEPAGEAADGQQIMVWLKDPGNRSTPRTRRSRSISPTWRRRATRPRSTTTRSTAGPSPT